MIATLPPDLQAEAIERLRASGALEDCGNKYEFLREKLWCGHPKTAVREVPDGRKGTVEVCSLCEVVEEPPSVFLTTNFVRSR